MGEKYPFILKSYKNNECYKLALRLGIESDIVIIGSAPEIFIQERLENNKVTFRYTERILKRRIGKNSRSKSCLWNMESEYSL